MIEPTQAPSAHPTYIQGLGILLALVILIAIFLVITHALTLDAQVYAGFLFLLYWAGLMHGDRKAFPAALAGSLTGIAIGWCVHMQPLLMPGVVGGVLLALVILGAIYLLIIKGAPLFINDATMLFLTVAATPLLADTSSAIRAGAAVLAAAVYAAALFALLRRLSAGRKGKDANSAPSH